MLKLKKVLEFLSLVFLLSTLGGCSNGQTPQAPETRDSVPPSISQIIPQGTKVDDLDLSGLEPQEGQARLKEWYKDKLAQSVNLVYNGTEISSTLQELGVEFDHAKTWERVEQEQGRLVSAVLKVDPVKFKEALAQKLKPYFQPPQDATYKISDDKFVIQPGKSGYTVDYDTFRKQIDGHSWQEIPTKIPVPVAEISPAVTAQSLQEKAFNAVIGQFSTKYNVSERNRSANLQAAAKALDKKVILPGEVFSFNSTVGPRTAETGYKDAYIIKNNKFVMGAGGGICQVSSTLYNAALLADLQIVERMPHAVAIAYVPLGQDATVNYPNIDFKFKNSTPGIIYIRTETKSGVLTVRLWGKESGQQVRLSHETEKTMPYRTVWLADPSLPPGRWVQDQPGAKGYIVKSWRISKDNQGVEKQEYLGRDVYAPANRIIRYGVRG